MSELVPYLPWRTGRKVGRTLYNADDDLIGLMDTPELAAFVVESVNPAWRRDAVPGEVCTCGCALESHRHDLKAQTCRRCACPGFVLAARVWHEHRYVTEEVQP